MSHNHHTRIETGATPTTRSASTHLPALVSRVINQRWPLPLGVFLLFLAIYGRTAAPSVLSGDSAEFQLAATLLGVPHPTTYPLYILLGKLTTLLIPFGEMAWRVTMLSAICAALAVALMSVLARRITGSSAAALVAALAFGFAPGLWNAATLAEVYALLAALLVGLGVLLHCINEHSLSQPSDRLPAAFYGAALVAGLGSAHHGLFVLCGLPLFAFVVLTRLLRRPYLNIRQLTTLALCFAAGLTPMLYPFVQFARYGPFNGWDYGLPQHYFWGAPQTWADVLDLIAGGAVRRGIFQLPSASAATAVLEMIAKRMWFEFGPLGVVLGLVGCVVLLRNKPYVWVLSAWVAAITMLYLLLLGPAVADAPIFTLPILLPWALWIATAVASVLGLVARFVQRWRTNVSWRRWAFQQIGVGMALLLVVATVTWGYTRIQHSSKRRLWLFREFGQTTLEMMPPNAAILTHWEQGMTLHYLRLVEGVRPDVWVDVVEPGDEAWASRAERRYADRPVYFVGRAEDLQGLSVDIVRADEYADLLQLQPTN